MLINNFYVLSEIDILPFPISAIHFHSYISALSLASRPADDAAHAMRHSPLTVLYQAWTNRSIAALAHFKLTLGAHVAALRSDGRLPPGPATNRKRHKANAQTKPTGTKTVEREMKETIIKSTYIHTHTLTLRVVCWRTRAGKRAINYVVLIILKLLAIDVTSFYASIFRYIFVFYSFLPSLPPLASAAQLKCFLSFYLRISSLFLLCSCYFLCFVIFSVGFSFLVYSLSCL